MKKNIKLNKNNIILAIATTTSLLFGAKGLYNIINQNSSQTVLTQEEISQRNSLLFNNEERKEIITPKAIGYIAEGSLIVISLSSGLYIYKIEKETESNKKTEYKKEKNSVIGSKVKRSFKTLR